MITPTTRVRTRSRPKTLIKPASSPFEDLELEIIYRSPSSLKAASQQLRRRGKGQVEQLASNIRRFGCVVPILITADCTIIDGHAICEAAKVLSLSKVPTVSIDHLTEDEIRVLRISVNRLAESSGWDMDVLKAEIEIISEIDLDLVSFTGFNTPEIDIILASGGEKNPDAADDVPSPGDGPTVSQPGWLWQFKGGHRLLCASALDVQNYKALLADDLAQIVFADLPYGCPVQGHISGLGRIKHREFAMASGEMDEESLQQFFRTIFEHLAAHSVDGSIHFSCIDHRSMHAMLVAGRAAYTELKSICTWDKGAGGMGSLYRSANEFVTVWKSGRGRHINNVELGAHGRNRTTVWSYPGFAQFGPGRAEVLSLHPTVKPIALVYDAILDVSKPGGIVLDPSVGSGTTLLAAHKAKRRGYGLELDPAYVDVAVRRLQSLTGEPARHADTGLTFEEMAEKRLLETGPTSESDAA